MAQTSPLCKVGRVFFTAGASSNEFAGAPYQPSGDFRLTEETFICGPASKDPRNNPGDPEFDPLNQTHSFSCVTDAVAFGANKQVKGRDNNSYKDNDAFNVPDSH